MLGLSKGGSLSSRPGDESFCRKIADKTNTRPAKYVAGDCLTFSATKARKPFEVVVTFCAMASDGVSHSHSKPRDDSWIFGRRKKQRTKISPSLSGLADTYSRYAKLP